MRAFAAAQPNFHLYTPAASIDAKRNEGQAFLLQFPLDFYYFTVLKEESAALGGVVVGKGAGGGVWGNARAHEPGFTTAHMHEGPSKHHVASTH